MKLVLKESLNDTIHLFVNSSPSQKIISNYILFNKKRLESNLDFFHYTLPPITIALVTAIFRELAIKFL